MEFNQNRVHLINLPCIKFSTRTQQRNKTSYCRLQKWIPLTKSHHSARNDQVYFYIFLPIPDTDYTTHLTPSFGNCLFAYHLVLKHLQQNVNVSSCCIPKVTLVKSVTQILKIGYQMKNLKPKNDLDHVF